MGSPYLKLDVTYGLIIIQLNIIGTLYKLVKNLILHMFSSYLKLNVTYVLAIIELDLIGTLYELVIT